ncbi:MAG TPA: PIG-L family deacetylase [Acidimicrobiales bacterium]|nr:PIG-L family deacetylase [Acidimicrobiales bacterium]
MATVCFFHAHPDDEAIATGGTMAKLASEGHRVLCVFATAGDLGEVEPGFLDDGEELATRRVAETEESCRLLGVSRVVFLGYRDSDMMGREGNDDPRSFWQADLDEAGARLAQVLGEEAVDVLVVYDDHGNYGHPDHIQVHRVGVRAAELAGTARVYESTFDRDRMRALMAASQTSEEVPDLPDTEGVDETMGSPGWMITTRVDVRAHLAAKRAAMAAHRSQISETSFFLTMPDDVFEMVWGEEDYIRRGAPAGTAETDLVDGL